MTKTWAEKTNKTPAFSFAPDWYVEAKKNGASKEQLFDMVKDFCRKALEADALEQGIEAEEPSDELVEITIASYDA